MYYYLDLKFVFLGRLIYEQCLRNNFCEKSRYNLIFVSKQIKVISFSKGHLKSKIWLILN